MEGIDIAQKYILLTHFLERFKDEGMRDMEKVDGTKRAILKLSCGIIQGMVKRDLDMLRRKMKELNVTVKVSGKDVYVIMSGFTQFPFVATNAMYEESWRKLIAKYESQVGQGFGN